MYVYHNILIDNNNMIDNKRTKKLMETLSISPILNMAVPVPALDMINIDPSMMLGISKCHLQ